MRGTTKRVQELRKESVDAVPRISIERALLLKQAYKKYEGKVSIPELRALAFKYICENRSLYFGDKELIVGEKGESPKSTPTYPELCCHTMKDLDIMDKREKIFFKVSDRVKEIHQKEIIPFFKERSIRKKIFDNVDKKWKTCYLNGLFTEFMEQRAPGHTVADGKIYEKGFKDIILEIENEIKNLDFLNDENALNKRNQLKAMKIACEGIIILGERYKKLALKKYENETDEKRKEELLEIYNNFKNIPKNKPESFQQAIQMYWLVHICVTNELNIWDAFSPGRLDQHLIKFYKRDLEKNNITRKKAKELLECFWIKFNNQPAPPKVGVTLKESGTYTDFANINTGGVTSKGKDGVNEVSYLILETMDELKLLQPSSNVQISKNTPKDFLLKSVEISKKGWGQPAFYNTEAIIKELLNAGKSIEDAYEGGCSGCVETGAYGKEAYILTGYFNLPKILELTLTNGYDYFSNKQIGLKLGEAKDFESYEDLLKAFKKNVKYFVDIKIKGNNIIEKIYADNMPAPFISTIIDDCIKKGKDYNAGGARYNTNYIQGVGIGTITDSLSAIKYNVFDKKRFTLEKLVESLKNNFENNEMIKHLVKNKTPKYGNDNEYADKIMQSVFKIFHDEVTGRKNLKDGYYRIDMLPTTCHVYFGSVMIASPNGRLKGLPVSDGISPAKGADVKGITKVINSSLKMDHLKTGGTLLNQKLAPESVKGDKGSENISSIIRSYFNRDGHHIQFNVIKKEKLIKAQNNPEKYKNLIVRVAGYSDYFNNLDKNLQNEIINRTEQNI
ncbi:MAG: trans-4-hydroxy-L-proline dehydratase [Bacillota bacterium]